MRATVQKNILDYAVPQPPKPAGYTSTDVLQEVNSFESFESSNKQEEQELIEHTSAVPSEQEQAQNTDQAKNHTEMNDTTTKNTSDTTPSVSPNCNFNRKGYCVTHQVTGKKTTVTSKVWKDRGGGRGYGYVARKVTKYLCGYRADTRRKINIPDEESRNLEQISGCEDYLTVETEGGKSDNVGGLTLNNCGLAGISESGKTG